MKMTSTKRFTVRTALVTGTTLATIVGAQALASLDETAFSQASPTIAAPAASPAQPADNTTDTASTDQAPAAAPNIVILRHAGQVSSATTNNAAVPQASIVSPQPITIQPPNPVQVAAPQPVAQQSAPRVARTRSSR